MRRIVQVVMLGLALVAVRPAQAQKAPKAKEVETAARAVAAELRRVWDARDNEAFAKCFAEPEGLFVSGGASYTVASLQAQNAKIWADRANESWKNDAVKVIVLGDDAALLQITFSGRYTLATGVTWEFASSAFTTVLIRRFGGDWKIVAYHNSGSGKQVPK